MMTACVATFGSSTISSLPPRLRKFATLLILSLVTFLASAKAHGRQLRLERELEGYQTVTFRAANPPWVESLWRAERYRFWGFTLALAFLFAVTLCPRAGRQLSVLA